MIIVACFIYIVLSVSRSCFLSTNYSSHLFIYLFIYLFICGVCLVQRYVMQDMLYLFLKTKG